MKTSATNRKLRVLLTGIQNKTLVPQPEFQRRLVWSNKHKLSFLKTVLEGYPFPEIYIAAGSVDSETGEGTEMLVDGQQRITTLFQYFKGSVDLKLSAEFMPYKELDEQRKLSFLEYEVVIRDLGNLPISEILEVFKRINSTNYSLNAMEIHNARYDGEFKEFGEKIANHKIFSISRFFTATEIRRMLDTQFCLSVSATMLGGYFNRIDAVETYLEKYNESFPESNDLLNQFNSVADFIILCDFDKNIRVWKKADMFTLIVELHRCFYKRKVLLKLSDTSAKLNRFYTAVDEAESSSKSTDFAYVYYKAALAASNDRGNRVRRGEVLQNVLDQTYEPQVSISSESV